MRATRTFSGASTRRRWTATPPAWPCSPPAWPSPTEPWRSSSWALQRRQRPTAGRRWHSTRCTLRRTCAGGAGEDGRVMSAVVRSAVQHAAGTGLQGRSQHAHTDRRPPACPAHRRATARRQLGRLLEAVGDCEAALRLEPNNKQAAEDRGACVAALLQQQGLAPPACWERVPVAAAAAPTAAEPAVEPVGGAGSAVSSSQRLSPQAAGAAAGEPAVQAAAVALEPQAAALAKPSPRPKAAAIQVISGGSDEEGESMPGLELSQPSQPAQQPADQRGTPAAQQAAAAAAATVQPVRVAPAAAVPGPFKAPRTGGSGCGMAATGCLPACIDAAGASRPKCASPHTHNPHPSRRPGL